MSTTHAQRPRITVLGCGVIGLTSAISLREAGYEVRILTKGRTPNTTSDVAAAFWYPFHIEGPRDLLRRYAEHTYEALVQILQEPSAGITMLAGQEYFETSKDDEEVGRHYWWRDIPDVKFRELQPQEIPNTHPFKCGFEFTVPVVHMPTYLRYLEKRFIASDEGKIVLQEVTYGNLTEILEDCDLVVNCTGLGAHTLCRDDKVYPIQGQILCVNPRPHWNKLIFITEGELSPMYIVPRGKHDIVLGGTTRDRKWGETPELDVAKDILQRCAQVYPEFNSLDLSSPEVKHEVGLRPARRETVRIEREVLSGKPIIHCYGHGGSGVTLSWGSAFEVVRLVKATL